MFKMSVAQRLVAIVTASLMLRKGRVPTVTPTRAAEPVQRPRVAQGHRPMVGPNRRARRARLAMLSHSRRPHENPAGSKLWRKACEGKL